MCVLWSIRVGPEVRSVGTDKDHRLGKARRIQLASQLLIMLKVDGIVYLPLVGRALFALLDRRLASGTSGPHQGLSRF